MLIYPSTVKMKFGQILVCCMTNTSNMILAQCCGLEISSRAFWCRIQTQNDSGCLLWVLKKRTSKMIKRVCLFVFLISKLRINKAHFKSE